MASSSLVSIWASLNVRHARRGEPSLDLNRARRLPPAARLVMVRPVTRQIDLSRVSDKLLRRVYLEALYRPEAATLRQLARRCESYQYSRGDVLRAARELRDLGLVRFRVVRK